MPFEFKEEFHISKITTVKEFLRLANIIGTLPLLDSTEIKISESEDSIALAIDHYDEQAEVIHGFVITWSNR